MIVKLSGTLAEVGEGSVVVERDGLAYEVMVPVYAVSELSAMRGGPIALHTMQYLEGNSAGGNLTPRLIGFVHPEDRAFFKQVITVKGLGVRKALKSMAAPAARIASWIEASDVAALAQLPGIGRRMADQMVAELHGKVSAHTYATGDVPRAARSEWSDEQRAAIEILTAWGDGRIDAERWIARAGQLHGEIGTAEEWVRAAYRIKGGAEK